MVYPGNESISPEIRKRIVETYRQTLDLAEQGSRQEALLGCDFILRLDPMFESARALAARLEEGESADVSDLRLSFESEVGGGAEPGEKAAPPPAVDLVDEAPPADTGEEDDLGVDELFDGAEPTGSSVSETAEREPLISPADLLRPDPPPAPPPSGVRPPAAEAPEIMVPPAPAKPPAAAASAAAEPPSGGTGPGAEPGPDLSTPSVDFAGEPAAALDSETQGRIDDLLAEGQHEFDRAEYQAAIDAWSRIFLIDIDHPEANRRIDLARKLKAEVERGVEEAMHEGIAALERRDSAGARAAFEKILELQPNHASARDYLARLDSDEPPFPAAEPEARPASGTVAGEGLEEADAEKVAPPRRRPSRPRPAKPTMPGTMAAKVSPAASRVRRFVYLGAAIFVVVAASGWFLWSRSSSLFPNAETTAQVPAPDPIARATVLFEQGKQSIAIAQLRRLGPDHPSYAEAQALIFQWESGLAEPEPGVDPEAERMAQRAELLQRARGLVALEQYIAADELLTQADSVAELSGEDAALAARIDERLDPIRTQIEIYKQGEWAIALRDLWRMRENGLRDPVATRLMVDCYYNLGVRDLQRGDTGSAEKRFVEAIELQAGDSEELERLRRFARLYSERKPDLLYRIFVKFLPFR